MKFCYVDESGHAGELTVVVGVLVDSLRMHRTKVAWESLLSLLDEISDGRVIEIKGRELYRGNAYWREWDGGERSLLIENIIKWMVDRKHAVTFGAVSKSKLNEVRASTSIEGFEKTTAWSIAAMHMILGVQKRFQREKQNKGNTVFVFDNVSEQKEILDLVNDPPKNTEAFYKPKKKAPPLDQVIDVPFFADSRHIGLIQVADLFAYILHLYAEITEGLADQKFDGELERLEKWIIEMQPVFLPDSSRWPKAPKDPFTKFLKEIAPKSLLSMPS